MDGEASKKVVLDYLSAQGRGDGETMAALLADDVQWRPPMGVPIGQPTGRDTVLQTMAEAGAKAAVAALKDATLIKSKKADWRLVAAAQAMLRGDYPDEFTAAEAMLESR